MALDKNCFHRVLRRRHKLPISIHFRMAQTQKNDQYKDSANLGKRRSLHDRYANRNWFDWVADQMELPDDGNVIDIGCGAGWFWSTARFNRRPLRLTLADTSENMVLEAVNRLCATRDAFKITAHVADASALPFADRSFDAAIAMHMLYHVPQPERAIGEMARILKPGGLIAVTTNGKNNMTEFFDLRRQAFGGATADPAASVFGIETAETFLRRHFDAPKVHIFEDSYVIDDPEDIYHYLVSFPPGSDASEAQKMELRRIIKDALDRQGGVLRVTRESALICAR